MVRGLILGGVAFAVVFAAERQFENFSDDVKRYDTIRAMSGDKPLVRQILTTVTDTLASFAGSGADQATDLIGSFTKDIVRYATLRSM
jgi:hypothetical protein